VGEMSKLTIKQEKFILKYFECGNATEAYKHAYNTSKMKDKTINEQASKLLADDKITTRLKELKDNAQKESEWNVQRLIKSHADIFEAGMGKLATNHLVTNGIGDGMSETINMEMFDTNLASAKGALIEIGKLIGAYEKDNKQKTGELDLLAILKSVAK
jgi:phage terminase small subunit